MISDVLLITCHPEIAAYMLENEEYKLKKLEKETNVTIFVRGDSSFHFEQFKFSDGSAKTL
jgi:Ribonuclease G/E